MKKGLLPSIMQAAQQDALSAIDAYSHGCIKPEFLAVLNIKREYPSSDTDLEFLSGISPLAAFPLPSLACALTCRVHFIVKAAQSKLAYGPAQP